MSCKISYIKKETAQRPTEAKQRDGFRSELQVCGYHDPRVSLIWMIINREYIKRKVNRDYE